LFRIAQEALQNTARHARARHATLSLARTTRELSLTVTDDGEGFDVTANRRNDGLGLVSIEERARLVQGQVTVRSERGNGTTITVRVPAQVVDSLHGRDQEQRHEARRPAPGRR
jgi:signal transduction histidine kinase